MNVVGALYIKDRKLLLDVSRKRKVYQLVAGKMEVGETPLQAMIRESHEEMGSQITFDESKLKQIMEFDEIASSDNITQIHYYLFEYNGELNGSLSTSEEIDGFLWYDTTMKGVELSNTLNHVVIPYCKKHDLID